MTTQPEPENAPADDVLREQIRRAVAAAENMPFESLEPRDYQADGGAGDKRRARWEVTLAPNALNVSAATDDAMALSDEESAEVLRISDAATNVILTARDTEIARLCAELEQAHTAALTQGVDAVALDRAATIPHHTEWSRGMCRAEALPRLLRHVAVAPADTTPEEAHPDKVAWTAEAWEDDRWMYLGTSPERAVIETRIAGLNQRHPKWPDGDPVRRRLVRATTTYTVQPATAPVRRCARCGHTPVDHNSAACLACPGGWLADHSYVTDSSGLDGELVARLTTAGAPPPATGTAPATNGGQP